MKAVVAILLIIGMAPQPLNGADDPWSLMTEHVIWMRANGYPKARLPDEFFQIPHSWLVEMTGNRRAAGACSDGVIYLDERFQNLRDPLVQGAIVHELVHIMQNNCAAPGSRAQRERVEAEAYGVQSKWFYSRYRAELIIRTGASVDN